MTALGRETGEPAQPAPARTSGLAIASLALGVIGFFALPLVARSPPSSSGAAPSASSSATRR